VKSQIRLNRARSRSLYFATKTRGEEGIRDEAVSEDCLSWATIQRMVREMSILVHTRRTKTYDDG
jgi:hypothetical protein